MTMRRIDVHHHILPTHYVETVGARPIGSQGSSGRVPEWSLAAAIELMDAAGIDGAVTSVSAPGVDLLPAAEAAGLAAWCNDFAADMAAKHARRFGFFSCLSLQSIDVALAEAVRAYDQLTADGVCLLSNYAGRYLGDAHFHPLYEELDRRAAVVFVHPTAPQQPVPIEGLSWSTLEFPFDTTRTIASLVFSGVTTRFPRIRWIFSHAGGAIPFLSGRVEVLTTNNPALRERIPNGFQAALEPLYFDTALSASAGHLAALRAVVPEKRILFGTDYPFGPKNTMQQAATALGSLGLPPELVQGIEAGHALGLFPRFSQGSH